LPIQQTNLAHVVVSMMNFHMQLRKQLAKFNLVFFGSNSYYFMEKRKSLY
jgi:hypothetical protein